MIPISQSTSNLYVENKGLAAGGAGNYFLRWFVPFYASNQDKKVSEFFIGYFTKFLKDDSSPVDKITIQSALTLAQAHVERTRGYFFNRHVPAESARLEHYILAIRQQLDLFDSKHPREALEKICRQDNKILLEKWKKLGYSEETFKCHPDFVDFIFKSHLHRHINHPYYKHGISMQPHLRRLHGRVVPVKEPCLLMDGRQAFWSDIRSKFHIDKEGRIYSKENGQNKYWLYLDQGLTQWDKYNFERPRHLRIWDRAPSTCQVQVVTTHAHKEDFHLGDRLLKGSRHTFFRIIYGQGFAQRHPNAGTIDGGEYSFGWGARWRDFSPSYPLTTLQGRWFCPDNFEFLKEDLCITPIDTTDEKVLNLMQIIRRRSQELYPYHPVTANCCGISTDVLREAGILNVETKNHMLFMWYKFFFPKGVRNKIEWFGGGVNKITPRFVSNAVSHTGKFLYSLIFAPIFSVLGAWRTTLSYEDEQDATQNKNIVRASNTFKGLFSNAFDLFNPNKMTFDMTKNVYKWQKKQAATRYEQRK